MTNDERLDEIAEALRFSYAGCAPDISTEDAHWLVSQLRQAREAMKEAENKLSEHRWLYAVHTASRILRAALSAGDKTEMGDG